MWRKIYKYYPFTSYTIDSLKNHYFVFSCPYDFNDPMDCQIYIDYHDRASEPNKFLNEVIEQTSADDPEFSSYIKDKLLLDESGCETKYYLQVIRNLISKLRVTCFSKSFSNTLMWAHYANNHQGYCLEFTYPDDQDTIFKYMSEVQYTSAYPYLNLPSFTDFNDIKDITENLFNEMISKLVLTKEDIWSYEEECRIVLTDEIGEKIQNIDKNIIVYPIEAITAIYYGCNCDDISINKILKEFQSQTKVNHFKLVRRKNNFGYDTLKIE